MEPFNGAIEHNGPNSSFVTATDHLRSLETHLSNNLKNYLKDDTLADLRVGYELLRIANEAIRAENDKLISAAEEMANERKRFRRLFENIQEPCITTDAEGNILDANEAALSFLGLSKDQKGRKSLGSLVSADKRKAFRSTLKKLNKQDSWFDGEIELQPHKAEDPLLWNCSAEVARDDNRGSVQITWLFHREEPGTVITKQTSESAPPSEEQQRRFNLHQQGHAALWNQTSRDSILELLAEYAAELGGHHCFVSLLSADKKYLMPVTAATRGQKSNGMVSTYKRAQPQSVAKNIAEPVLQSGSPRIISTRQIKVSAEAKASIKQGPVDMMIVPLRANGDVIGLLTLIREKGSVAFTMDDVKPVQSLADHASSLILNLTLKSRVCNSETQQAEASALAVNLCNDLQGPLHAILGYSAMLIEPQPDWCPEAIMQDATVINKSATYVNTLITELLDIAQMEIGAITCKTERVAVNEFLADIELDLFGANSHQPECQIKVDEATLGMHLKVDPVRARRTVKAGFDFARQISEVAELKSEVTEGRLWLTAQCREIRNEILDIRRFSHNELGFVELDPRELLTTVDSQTNLRMMFARRYCEVCQVEFKVRFSSDSPDGEILMGFLIR